MTVVPEGYELLGAEDAEGRIQHGDLLWCEGNWEWQEAESQKLETMFRASMRLHEKTRTETSPCSGVVACDQRPD